ncbi:hypothetical protein H5410_034492 [Solanum commersonii]|uniref:Uncharacterized protein n=1 Tax=Solanum commersonii TaxID=4109 RepID=A0A9J5YRU3_SOLCO|nr:hypothetical protein H5410_034492 [Solanum commersonii]
MKGTPARVLDSFLTNRILNAFPSRVFGRVTIVNLAKWALELAVYFHVYVSVLKVMLIPVQHLQMVMFMTIILLRMIPTLTRILLALFHWYKLMKMMITMTALIIQTTNLMIPMLNIIPGMIIRMKRNLKMRMKPRHQMTNQKLQAALLRNNMDLKLLV